MRRPLVIYDFVTDPFLISVYMRKIFMYLRAILCTFQISVDFYYVPVGGRGGAGRGGGNRERVIEGILYGYS